MPGFSQVQAPLHRLTWKDAPFAWAPEYLAVFEELKKLLTMLPILAYPDYSKAFIVEVDASGTGLGAVLAQHQSDNTVRPIAYASQLLQLHERNYGWEWFGSRSTSGPTCMAIHVRIMGHSVITEYTAAFWEAGKVGDGHLRVTPGD